MSPCRSRRRTDGGPAAGALPPARRWQTRRSERATKRRVALALSAIPLIAACTGPAAEPGPAATPSSPSTTGPGSAASSGAPSSGARPRVVRTVAEDLDTPWGIAFLPDGTALVTERDSGRVLLVGRGTPRVVGTVRQVSDENDEAGLLGVAVGPRFAQDRRVWLYVTSDEDNRIVTTTYADGRLGPVRPVLTGIPKGAIHDGGRLAFGPDGYLYASTGETGQRELAADLRSLGGKILRITGAGDPAPGNPFPGSPVWSWGHRNVQGLAWVGSELWASEFGADTWDELNRVERGRDHGWPAVEGRGGTGSQVDPALVWRTADASPSGLAWAGGALWMAALRGERLWRIPVRGGEAGRPEGLFIGEHGRMRTVARTPEGRLWVTTSNRDGRGSPGADDDRILEVAP